MKTYHIYVEHKPEMTENLLKIDIYIKLTPEELEILGRQQLQVNEQKMMGGDRAFAKTISYTHMIEHIIKPSKKNFEGKILINHDNVADKVILTKYMENLLTATSKYLLHKKPE